MLDKQECILPKQKVKKNGEKWTWKIERETGLQNEVREEREKPELYVIQSFQSQIIIDEVKWIWLNTTRKQQNEREEERKRERNIDVTQARVLVTFSSA